jgi:hypothetical protein
VSPKGRPVRCGGGAMNESLDFDHTALAELISRRWQEDRPYFTLNRKARGAWLEGSWSPQPANSSLRLRWSRRSSSALQMQTVFARMPLQKPTREDSL